MLWSQGLLGHGRPAALENKSPVFPVWYRSHNRHTRTLPALWMLYQFIGKSNMKPHERWNMLFLLKNFHWTLMVSIQSLTYKLLQADVHTCAWGRRWRHPGAGDGFCAVRWAPTIHFPAFWAFCADLVTLPAPPLFFSTFLMTPTATVCRMSRTAKRPVEGRGKGGSRRVGSQGSFYVSNWTREPFPCLLQSMSFTDGQSKARQEGWLGVSR